MNTLDDLRRTLDQHAADVADPSSVVRTAAVHHRVAGVRRRRRALGSGALALLLVAGVATALWPRHDRNALPAAPVVLGEQAPTTIHSLGYTYRTDGTAESGTQRAGVVVAKSDQPQLYSWTADRVTEVKVHVPGDEVWHSLALHFRDFVVVPPGASGRLTVAAPEGKVAIARYALTDAAAPGYTRNGVTYRDSVAGRSLLGATVAAPGSTESAMHFVTPGGPVEFAPLCTGVPTGYDVLVTVNGRPAVSGGCSDPNAFDPAGSGGYIQGAGPAGRSVAVRVLLTKGLKSSTPAAGDFPHLRLGIGAYGPLSQEHLAGTTVDNVIEHGGHTWTMTQSSSSHGAPLRVPGSAVDRVASLVWGVGGFVRATFGVEGETPEAGEFANGPGGGGGAMGGLWVPADRAVHARLAHDKGPFAVVLYQRSD